MTFVCWACSRVANRVRSTMDKPLCHQCERDWLDHVEREGGWLGEATAQLIHLVRANGMVPARLGSSVQYRKLVASMINAGWIPPEEHDA